MAIFLRHIQSCWYYQPSFVISTLPCCLSPLLFGSTLPPPPPRSCVNRYTAYTSTLCTGGSVWGSVGDHILQYSFTLCIWPNSEPTKLPEHRKQKRGGGLKQINMYLPQSPFPDQFFIWGHLHCLLWVLSFYRKTVQEACRFTKKHTVQ
jgi:hypothetical protein